MMNNALRFQTYGFLIKKKYEFQQQNNYTI